MENIQNSHNDQWQIKLDKAIEELKKCQQSKGLDSCMKCQEIFSCQIKASYVKTVYESMNKGSGGGFEF